MKRAATIGLDIAKDVFQAHGADKSGETIFNRKLRRSELLDFFKRIPKCVVGIEACGTAHHWARSIQKLGHQVWLIHPSYVKPFVKRDKTDANDAEAINEALSRKTMRFVTVKSVEQQASGLNFKLRSLLVRQRAQLANSLRSHLAEFGIVVRGSGFASVIASARGTLSRKGAIPVAAHAAFEDLIGQLEAINGRIHTLEQRILTEARQNGTAQRLMTIPGVGPITAMAIISLVPSAEAFKTSRHFAAWIGLTPRNHSSGGVQVIGAVSKMGNRQLRSLLVLGAISVLRGIKRDEKGSVWISRLKKRRPYRVAAVAVANKTARIIWSILTNGGGYDTLRGHNLAADASV